MSGLLLLGGLVSGVAILVPVALVLGLVVLLALRGEPDDGGRGMTVYLVLACFVGFVTLLFAATAAAASVTDLVAGDDDDSINVTLPTPSSSSSSSSSSEGFGFSPAPTPIDGDVSFGSSRGQSHDDRAWTSLIQSLIAALAALVVLRFHWPRLETVGGRATPGGASARARQAYCATVCFVVVVTLLVSASVATFNIVQAIAPGTTGAGNRGDALETFVPVAVLALGAALLFRVHWSRLETPAFLRPLPTSEEGAAA